MTEIEQDVATKLAAFHAARAEFGKDSIEDARALEAYRAARSRQIRFEPTAADIAKSNAGLAAVAKSRAQGRFDKGYRGY